MTEEKIKKKKWITTKADEKVVIDTYQIMTQAESEVTTRKENRGWNITMRFFTKELPAALMEYADYNQRTQITLQRLISHKVVDE